MLWFGALDLVNYLDAQQFSFENKSVIELGCGHGLPGIYTLMRNANVVFQDLNKETLLSVTIPSVLLNCGPGSLSRCTFIEGEWHSVYSCVQSTQFDFILASDISFCPS